MFHVQEVAPAMDESDPLRLTIRCGFLFEYEAARETPVTLLVEPPHAPSQQVLAQKWVVEPQIQLSGFVDGHGNLAHRIVLPKGRTRLLHDVLVAVSPEPEPSGSGEAAVDVSLLPESVLRYTLPSRYCDSDRLMDFAFEHFGNVPNGGARVQAICDWIHNNVEYRFGSGSPVTAASDTLRDRFGVCRDFAHAAIALCRCFNIPARYVTGYLPDIEYENPAPMDFHAYFQAYLGRQWWTFDARFNVPRIGRIHIATGLDAVDGAFGTVYGAATLSWFEVWSYPVDPADVVLGVRDKALASG